MEANYSQIVPMTFDERVKMYMELDKEMLAKMLAMRDTTYNTFVNDRCTSWQTCMNPHRDCINCPLRGQFNDYITSTNVVYTSSTSTQFQND